MFGGGLKFEPVEDPAHREHSLSRRRRKIGQKRLFIDGNQGGDR